ncbi:MAG: HzsA-related protein, partial [Planctomycetota bacterium]
MDLTRRDAIVYVTDVYLGEGLRGVPRGIVKKLRVLEPHFAYPRMGGHICIGIDGPWDVHRILGTVPVKEDGSAIFRAPANTPLAVQPLDAEGKALQVMRSWLTAMPGEVRSCVGCHEGQNAGPSPRRNISSYKEPSEITPWYGPARGFGFKREVQPVLDKYCVGCHNGKPRDGKTIPNFADTGRGWKGFTKSYVALHPFVRRPGPESDYHIQKPCEWHADTSELIQMLQKGHNGVKLSAEAWSRLITWIDLNVPDHGTWGEFRKVSGDMRKRRLEMRNLYANRPEDPEAYPSAAPERPAFVKPAPMPRPSGGIVRCAGWPMDAAEAAKRQTAAGAPRDLRIDLGGGKSMELVLVPAGEFVMGDAKGFADERPVSRVKIAKPFYIGKYEVTNEEYRLFDSTHDSAYISVYNKDQGNRGIAANTARQPVIRITWKQASAFCEWLSRKSGRKFSLPSEAEWEYACRAGTDTPMNYGERDADFSKHANLADQRVLSLCRRDSPKWVPCVNNVDDGA